MTARVMAQAVSSDSSEKVRGADSQQCFELFQTLNFLCAAQLYLSNNVLLERPLASGDVKAHPQGHWGTGPPVNWALTFATLLRRAATDAEITVVHGAGHAGPSALALAYITGELGEVYTDLRHGRAGLERLIGRFPEAVAAGDEITPAVPGVKYMGGELGNALAFAQGLALDAPAALVMPLIGDGECETGATAAAWLGARALAGKGAHGCVLPVVLLNGMRMGAPSLLAGMTKDALHAYFTGLGYRPFFVRPVLDDAGGCFPLRLLADLVGQLEPLGDDRQSVLVLQLAKGATGPTHGGGRPIAGTVRVHKAPLVDPATSPTLLAELEQWLHTYEPGALLPEGHPNQRVAALTQLPQRRDRGTHPPVRARVVASDATLADALRVLHEELPLRVFSPDELWSNRIELVDDRGHGPEWVVEILNENLCDSWARGFCAQAPRRSVVISYEAFSSLLLSQIVQATKARRLARNAGMLMAAPVHVFTSLGWQNSYSHRSTALSDWLVTDGPADARLHFPLWSVGGVITQCLRDDAQHFIWYCKHTRVPAEYQQCFTPVDDAALVMPTEHPPDLAYVSIGDRAALEVATAVTRLRETYGVTAAHVAVTELHAARRAWPHIAAAAGIDLAPPPTLVVGVLGRRALYSYAETLLTTLPTAVYGFDSNADPLSTEKLASHCGLEGSHLIDAGLQALGPPTKIRP